MQANMILRGSISLVGLLVSLKKRNDRRDGEGRKSDYGGQEVGLVGRR